MSLFLQVFWRRTPSNIIRVQNQVPLRLDQRVGIFVLGKCKSYFRLVFIWIGNKKVAPATELPVFEGLEVGSTFFEKKNWQKRALMILIRPLTET